MSRKERKWRRESASKLNGVGGGARPSREAQSRVDVGDAEDGADEKRNIFCVLSQFLSVWRFSDTTRGHCFLLFLPDTRNTLNNSTN